MGKIKGWKKFAYLNDKRGMAWRGKNIKRIVSISHTYSSLGQWKMNVSGMNNSGEVNYSGLKYSRYFDTKQDAYNYGISFMKMNQNG